MSERQGAPKTLKASALAVFECSFYEIFLDFKEHDSIFRNISQVHQGKDTWTRGLLRGKSSQVAK
jgi:hypothetical protein